MIELHSRQTPTSLAITIGAALMTGQLQYPARADVYEIQQVKGTYSDYVGGATVRPLRIETVAQQIAVLYSSFAERQERLGEEFEAAIYSDLKDLYEA